MKKLLSSLLIVFALFSMQDINAQEVNYTPTFTGSRTNANRSINSVNLQSASYQGYPSNSLTLTSAEKTQCYVDKSGSVTMKAGAGERVTLSVSVAGEWMNSFVYIDADKNGFTAGIADDRYTPTGDLVSYSFYNNNSTNDESGWNSDGTIINGDSRSNVNLPSFNVPQELGPYRMRIKLDWCNIDPNGDNDGKFGDFMANGGHIIDVTLEVAEMQEGAVSRIFNTTSIENNAFAQGTTWYTLQIGANGYVIDNNNGATYIALDEVKSNACDDAQLWAFTGDDINGYRLYNKQAGTSKVLAAPTTMSGTTGSASYPILVDAASVPAGYTDLWLFQTSSDLGEGDTYYYMFEKACKKLAEWNGGEFGEISISCNFTRSTISEVDFREKLKTITDRYTFDRARLVIEITEDSIEKNLDVAVKNIFRVKELGFSIALDDIGSGYTSLVNLCEYPIDVVKVDREILLKANGERGKKLFYGIISLAHYLNLKVVCEGVENAEQNSFVHKSDCDYIQGWYYFKGLSEEKAEALAREYMSKL